MAERPCAGRTCPRRAAFVSRYDWFTGFGSAGSGTRSTPECRGLPARQPCRGCWSSAAPAPVPARRGSRRRHRTRERRPAGRARRSRRRCRARRPVACTPAACSPARSPTLLPEIDEHAGALGDDGGQRAAELLAAVASKRAQHIARPALGVEPDERCVAPGDVAVNEGDRLGTAMRIREGDGIKRPDAGRKTRIAESADATVRDALASRWAYGTATRAGSPPGPACLQQERVRRRGNYPSTRGQSGSPLSTNHAVLSGALINRAPSRLADRRRNPMHALQSWWSSSRPSPSCEAGHGRRSIAAPARTSAIASLSVRIDKPSGSWSGLISQIVRATQFGAATSSRSAATS